MDPGCRFKAKVAIGGHPEEKILCTGGQVTKVMTTKHYPPDTLAAIYWLNNRRPDRWRQKQEVSGPNGAPIQITILPEEANL